MFLSYKEIKYLGYDAKTKLQSWEYKIIDSEFEEIGAGVIPGGSGFVVRVRGNYRYIREEKPKCGSKSRQSIYLVKQGIRSANKRHH